MCVCVCVCVRACVRACVFRRLRQESRLQGVGEAVRMAQNQVHATFPFMRSSQANKERMGLYVMRITQSQR